MKNMFFIWKEQKGHFYSLDHTIWTAYYAHALWGLKSKIKHDYTESQARKPGFRTSLSAQLKVKQLS